MFSNILFNTQDLFFRMSDHYLEFSSDLPSENIFGLGERVSKFKLNFPGKYTIWARDLPGEIDIGSGGQNTYGMFPLYLMREKKGFFHVAYLRNSNGMDVILGKKKQKPIITYKIVGGIIDFKFFLSENKSVEEAVRAYHVYIRGYTFQPFWSFGFHQSRWGYQSWEMVKSVLNNYQNVGMPLDAIWMDIDYMNEFKIFTIEDPGVKVDYNDTYDPYKIGIERNIFIKQGSGQTPLLAKVWPGFVNFPDFFNPEAQEYGGYVRDFA